MVMPRAAACSHVDISERKNSVQPQGGINCEDDGKTQ